jgi:hypothetical protein
MKPKSRLSLFAAVLFSLYAVACGGGNTTVLPPPPPPPGVNFSNASLNGQYAFSMAGTDFCGGFNTLLARAGSFTADGSGHITAGVEDVNDACIGAGTLQFTSGSYSIQADGHGTLQLKNSSGTTNYGISLSTTSKGFIVQTDLNATASGSFRIQNPAAFSNAGIAGGYVFDFNGISAGLSPESIVGRFTADGGGGINTGVFDSNIGGVPSSAQQVFPPGAFYQVDTNDNGSMFGRGTANIAGHNFIFYVVDATRWKFLSSQADFPTALLGDASTQQNVAFTPSSLNGNFTFLIGGASTTGPITTAGRFTADGAGVITNVFLDENDSGFVSVVPNGTVSGTYTVDANGLGGGTLTWKDTKTGTFTFIFYLASPTQAVLQETDSNITSDGSFLAQTNSPITAALMAGDYAFNWTGVSSDEEDFAGHLALTNASPSAASGTMNFNEFGAGEQFINAPITGTLTFAANPEDRNLFQANTTATNPSTNFHFSAYVVDGDTFFLVGVDNNRVILGVAARQP